MTKEGLTNVNPRSTHVHSNTFSLQFTDSNNFRMSSNGDFRAINTPEKILQVCVKYGDTAWELPCLSRIANSQCNGVRRQSELSIALIDTYMIMPNNYIINY